MLARGRSVRRVSGILFVCTGNICRSPIAQYVLGTRLADLDGVELRSAGTHPPVGRPMTPEAVILAREFGARGGHSENHRATFLTTAQIETSDLVLTAKRRHRRFAVELAPRRLRQTFTVREFARIAGSMPEAALSAAAVGPSPHERLQGLVAAIAAHRAVAPPPPAPEDDDVVDPYGKDDETYRLCARQLMPALDVVERVVRLAHL
jgi:protein-tyrosine phosphatase